MKKLLMIIILLSIVFSNPKNDEQNYITKVDHLVNNCNNYYVMIDSHIDSLIRIKELLELEIDFSNISIDDQVKLVNTNRLAIESIDHAIMYLKISKLIMKRVSKENLDNINE